MGFDLMAHTAPMEQGKAQGRAAKQSPVFSRNQRKQKDLLCHVICLCTHSPTPHRGFNPNHIPDKLGQFLLSERFSLLLLPFW